MTWTVRLGGDKTCLLDDLSPSTFQAIADRYSMSWLDLYYGPAANLDAFYDLLFACAQKCDVDAPDKPETMGQARALLEMLERSEDDDRPKAGTPPVSPSTEDDPETT